MKKNSIFTAEQKKRLKNLIGRLKKISPQQGAFYLFPAVPGGNGEEFSKRAMKYDLLVVPGEGFGCPGHIRISYCVAEDTIRRALPLFAKLMEEYQNGAKQ